MAVVSGEPPDDVAGGEVRSAGDLDLPLVLHRCQKGFCWNGLDETFNNFVEEDRCFSLCLSCRDGRFKSFSIFVMEAGGTCNPV